MARKEKENQKAVVLESGSCFLIFLVKINERLKKNTYYLKILHRQTLFSNDKMITSKTIYQRTGDRWREK